MMTRKKAESRQSVSQATQPRDGVVRLEDIPNVGPAIAGDLRKLRIMLPTDLHGRDPYAMYDDLCRIIGSGSILSAKPYPARSDSSRAATGQRGTPLFVDVNFDVLVEADSDSILPTSRLNRGALASIDWDKARSGVRISDQAAQELDK